MYNQRSFRYCCWNFCSNSFIFCELRKT